MLCNLRSALCNPFPAVLPCREAPGCRPLVKGAGDGMMGASADAADPFRPVPLHTNPGAPSMLIHVPRPSRRAFLGGLSFGAALFTTRGLFADELVRTPAQTE